MSGGIYKITNRVNGRFYIGRALNIEARWEAHRSKLRTGKHLNRLMQEDCNKYGLPSFVFEVLESLGDRKQIIKREHEIISRYFDRGDKCYNLIVSSGADHGEGLTSAQRQRRRRDGLDRIARENGFDTWEKLKTAAIRGDVKLESIRPEK